MKRYRSILFAPGSRAEWIDKMLKVDAWIEWFERKAGLPCWRRFKTAIE